MGEEQLIKITSNLGIWKETLTDKHDCNFDAYVLTAENLLEFARVIYTKGFKVGYDEGWYSTEYDRDRK